MVAERNKIKSEVEEYNKLYPKPPTTTTKFTTKMTTSAASFQTETTKKMDTTETTEKTTITQTAEYKDSTLTTNENKIATTQTSLKRKKRQSFTRPDVPMIIPR